MKSQEEIQGILDLFKPLSSEEINELGTDHFLALATLCWVLEGGEFPVTLPGEE